MIEKLFNLNVDPLVVGEILDQRTWRIERLRLLTEVLEEWLGLGA